MPCAASADLLFAICASTWAAVSLVAWQSPPLEVRHWWSTPCDPISQPYWVCSCLICAQVMYGTSLSARQVLGTAVMPTQLVIT